MHYLQRDGVFECKQPALLGTTDSGWFARPEYRSGSGCHCHSPGVLGLGTGLPTSILWCALRKFLGLVLGGLFFLTGLSASRAPRRLDRHMVFPGHGPDPWH